MRKTIIALAALGLAAGTGAQAQVAGGAAGQVDTTVGAQVPNGPPTVETKPHQITATADQPSDRAPEQVEQRTERAVEAVEDNAARAEERAEDTETETEAGAEASVEAPGAEVSAEAQAETGDEPGR